ncbi:MAG TPA: hypothetical protein VIW26_03665 [Gemmatimonadales bacterium]|jgi:hypothetical protein
MPTLTIEFHGICVHFDQDQNPDLRLPQAHRVVLTHVPEAIVWNDEIIPIHQPKVIIASGDVIETIIPDGVTMSLGALAGAPPFSVAYECVPSLTTIDPAVQIDPGIVVGNEPPAVLYFDIDQGSLACQNIEGSAGMVLTIETTQDTFQLTTTDWQGGSETKTYPIAQTSIHVTNLGQDGESQRGFDLILSFAVTTEFPPPENLKSSLERVLGEIESCLNEPDQHYDIGPGCSNSHFP